MTATSKIKRLDKVEIQLTPKEWAIWMSDEIRKSGNAEFLKKLEDRDPYGALSKQAEEKYPGKKPEDISARNKLRRELATEFHTLKKLAGTVNEIIQKRAEKAGLEAALKISTLQTVILQDAFGRTAKKAAGWIEILEAQDKDEEENRQVILEELRAYMDVDFGEKFSDSIHIGDMKLRFPSVIENWIKEAVQLIRDIYGHQAAVQIIQDTQFDGHLILIKEIEFGLKKAILSVEDSVGSFNEYLDIRAKLFKAEWEEEEEHEGGLVSAIPGEREGALKIDLEKIKAESVRVGKELAKTWTTDARDEAIYDIRQNYGEGDIGFKEICIKRGWIKP